jgi:hypothetical protein
MKSFYGKEVLRKIVIETHYDLEMLLPIIDNLKELGYMYDSYDNTFIIESLKERLFIEKNTSFTLEEKSISIKDGIKTGFTPLYYLPALIKEQFYWNNETFQEYSYLYIPQTWVLEFNKQNKAQYVLKYNDDLLRILLSNNFVGIKTQNDFGFFKAGIPTQCSFMIQYNRYQRNVINLVILNIHIEDSVANL